VSPDGRWLAWTLNENGAVALYLAPAAAPERGRRIEMPVGVQRGRLKFDPTSQRVAFDLSSSQSSRDVYSVDVASGKLTRWTFSELGGLSAAAMVKPTLVEYPSFDGRKIPAWVYAPHAARGKQPVLIIIHGGPESQFRPDFQGIIDYYTNELGVVVIAPNVRGSAGYGKSYLLLDNGDKREDSVKDIGALLDWIGKQPTLDASRVGVYGGSYGGYMVLATLFHYPERIRCGVDVVGISNFVTFLEHTQDYRRDLRRAEYGDERDPKMRELLTAISPTTNARKIKSPLFVIQGKNDPRVPASEAEQIVQTIRGNGGAVWYLLAKDEGHGFQKKVNRDFMYPAMSLFFETYLLK
jgi:dipeptidyl aminopeptidase/acylaminoacyl peptidase